MEFVRGKKLGHGSFGTVSLAKSKRTSSDGGKLMAVKTCGFFQSDILMKEKATLDEFKHCPEIIQCYGDCYTFENDERLYNVLLEYASGGTLSDKIENSINHRLPENEIRQYVKAILKGLDCIHKHGYVHCDIKVQNILLNQYEKIKIADFGLTKKSGAKKEGNLKGELRGTPMYMSPEMVLGGYQESPADIWAVGCLMIDMFIGAPVWDCNDSFDLFMKIGVDKLTPRIPAEFSEEGKDFVRCCFIKDPEERWTAEMLLSHAFIAIELDHHSDALKITPSSPRSGLDFSEWDLDGSLFTQSIIPSSTLAPLLDSSSCRDSELNSRDGDCRSKWSAERLRKLVSDEQVNWSCSDEWFTIR